MPSVTLTFTGAHATRIADAYGVILELDRPATAEEYKAHLIADTRQVVRNIERQIIEASNVEIT